MTMHHPSTIDMGGAPRLRCAFEAVPTIISNSRVSATFSQFLGKNRELCYNFPLARSGVMWARSLTAPAALQRRSQERVSHDGLSSGYKGPVEQTPSALGRAPGNGRKDGE
jgi:hypothetical protein